MSREEQLELARENVAWAAGRAAEYGVEVLVEAVNTFENGPYLLYTTRDAAAFVRSVGAANVGLQYDFYHMQRMEGNLSVNVREHIGEIGHVQVADSPARGEPGTGEIHYLTCSASSRARLRRLRRPRVQPHHGEDRGQLRVDTRKAARRRRECRRPETRRRLIWPRGLAL